MVWPRAARILPISNIGAIEDVLDPTNKFQQSHTRIGLTSSGDNNQISPGQLAQFSSVVQRFAGQWDLGGYT